MGKEQRQKCYNQDFIGPLYSRMPTHFVNHVISVKGHEILEKEKKCL